MAVLVVQIFLDRVLFCLIQLNEELALASNSYAGGSYLRCYDYYLLDCIAYLIILELVTMYLQGDTIHIQWTLQILCIWGTGIGNSSVGLLDFYFFVSICLSICQTLDLCVYLQFISSLKKGITARLPMTFGCKNDNAVISIR